MKSLAIIIGTAALGIHGIAGAALPADVLKRQTRNGSGSHCAPGADLCGWRESGPLCCSPPPDDPGNGPFPPGNIIGTRDEKDSNVRRGKTSDSFQVCKDGTFNITRAMAEEVRPFYASTDKTKCNKCRVFQDPFDMCEELRESFSWVLFFECYKDLPCPTKRDAMPQPIPGTDSKDKLHAPELNPGAKGQKLSQRSEIDARAALADAVPNPSSKDANVLAAAMYNGRLQERTETEIAERDAIPDLPTHLDEEYYRYTERQVSNPDPTASHPNPAPKPEIRRAWGGAGMLKRPKPKTKPPHPALPRSRRAWGKPGMINNAKPKLPRPNPPRPF